MIPHDTHLHIGSLLFEGVDQIDLTGPFEVLSRIPNATYRIYGKTAAPVRDVKGLWLTPDATLADAPPLDVLHVPGGFGQEALMEDAEVLGWIRQQAAGACSIFSVCTGALHLRRGRPAQGTPGDDALGVVSPAAILRRDPRQRTCGRRWRLGLRRRRHGRHRRRLAPRGRVARRRGRAGHPTSHGLCAGAALRQRHARDGASRDTGASAAIGAGHHGAARANGATHRRQTRHRRSGRETGMSLARAELVWREPRVYWRARQRPRS